MTGGSARRFPRGASVALVAAPAEVDRTPTAPARRGDAEIPSPRDRFVTLAYALLVPIASPLPPTFHLERASWFQSSVHER